MKIKKSRREFGKNLGTLSLSALSLNALGINGGHLFGRYPDLQLGGERDADSRDRGRWILQTSTQQTAAIMSNWFGIKNRDIEGIFPTLANFEDSFGANANLNFMQQGA